MFQRVSPKIMTAHWTMREEGERGEKIYNGRKEVDRAGDTKKLTVTTLPQIALNLVIVPAVTAVAAALIPAVEHYWACSRDYHAVLVGPAGAVAYFAVE